MGDVVPDLAAGMLACLCSTLTDAGRGVCRCALYHGQTPPPADDCACECATGRGQAWVRLVDATATQTSGLPLPCGTGQWLYRLELGVYRCVSTPDDAGYPPSGGQQTADAMDAYADAAVLRHVAACCPTLGELDVRARVEVWRPIGPSGGCAGSTVTMVVEP